MERLRTVSFHEDNTEEAVEIEKHRDEAQKVKTSRIKNSQESKDKAEIQRGTSSKNDIPEETPEEKGELNLIMRSAQVSAELEPQRPQTSAKDADAGKAAAVVACYPDAPWSKSDTSGSKQRAHSVPAGATSASSSNAAANEPITDERRSFENKMRQNRERGHEEDSSHEKVTYPSCTPLQDETLQEPAAPQATEHQPLCNKNTLSSPNGAVSSEMDRSEAIDAQSQQSQIFFFDSEENGPRKVGTVTLPQEQGCVAPLNSNARAGTLTLEQDEENKELRKDVDVDELRKEITELKLHLARSERNCRSLGREVVILEQKLQQYPCSAERCQRLYDRMCLEQVPLLQNVSGTNLESKIEAAKSMGFVEKDIYELMWEIADQGRKAAYEAQDCNSVTSTSVQKPIGVWWSNKKHEWRQMRSNTQLQAANAPGTVFDFDMAMKNRLDGAWLKGATSPPRFDMVGGFRHDSSAMVERSNQSPSMGHGWHGET
eukprot:gnl/MRDRNA2_/MRDRNA2_36149_c0_seq2.p1 gnl/MRDRNA2_/MRDRNA2_36149_c0~~gnl/MRDRNA2_/MRDRNA2_36149_c0_seq2.p1  ORF type:complete len:488 (+),score=115.32 gnl/MRDRNA2_/MRDRNA2_36149_c0_seq2:246-1709(+)